MAISRSDKLSCDRCGSFQWIAFNVRDDVWSRIVGDPDACLCLNCFLELANNKDIRLKPGDFECIFVAVPKPGTSFYVKGSKENPFW